MEKPLPNKSDIIESESIHTTQYGDDLNMDASRVPVLTALDNSYNQNNLFPNAIQPGYFSEQPAVPFYPIYYNYPAVEDFGASADSSVIHYQEEDNRNSGQCACPYCINFYDGAWYQNFYSNQSFCVPNNSLDMFGSNHGNYLYSNNKNEYHHSSDLNYKNTNFPTVQEIDQKISHLTTIYVNQPVPSQAEHFQRKLPFRRRDSNPFSWITLYLELEKHVDSPTSNARIAWMNDMHHVVYTKLTSGTSNRWQYEYEFHNMKSLIDIKCTEADNLFKMYPLICKCGERFRNQECMKAHSSDCSIGNRTNSHICLCGGKFDNHYHFLRHIFDGELGCAMAVYHLWIFYEKYRRRRYKCSCDRQFYNFWVYYVHLSECAQYRNLFFRNCPFCKDFSRKSHEYLNFHYELTGPLKDLVLHSRLQ